MKQDLLDPMTANNVSYVLNLLFDVLGIILIVLMIFTLITLYAKVIRLIKNDC